jgi:hypothetical protein
MQYKGSCHCGHIAFDVEGEIGKVMECNCSMCRRKGGLLWFVPRNQFKLNVPQEHLSTYTFNKHLIHHHFCAKCGCAPFSFGVAPDGAEMAAVNVRCLEDVNLDTLERTFFDGRSV